jgi:hypothetical protein
MSERCPFGWWGAHNFQPRYDLGASKWAPETYFGFDAAKHVEGYRDKTYVQDVCTRCGKVITRDVGSSLTPEAKP